MLDIIYFIGNTRSEKIYHGLTLREEALRVRGTPSSFFSALIGKPH